MKKLIVFHPGIWAERLLTVERYKEISYFVTDQEDTNDTDISVGIEYQKKIRPVKELENEDKDNIIIIIADNSKYNQARMILENMGFVQNVHFFNGWKLNLSFYKTLNCDSSWMDYEQKNSEIIKDYSFDLRTKTMLSMFPEDVKSVMDLGCGESYLKKILNPETKYIGVDICERENTSYVCNLNKDSLPDEAVDMYYMAGLIYYIDDIDRLISQMTRSKYILFDYGGIERHLRLDGVPHDPLANARNNFYSLEDIFNSLIKYGFSMTKAKWDLETGKIGWHIYLFKNTRI